MSKKKPKVTPEERAIFRDAMSRNPNQNNDNQLINNDLSEDTDTPITDMTGDAQSLLERIAPEDWLSAEDSIHFARAGIQHRLIQKLKRGQMPIQARLDLHRLTGDSALSELARFIADCVQHKFRCVIIVHGKGKIQHNRPPVLKNVTHLWLQQQPQVLAFTSARPKDGGTGALYVLLRTRN